MERKINLSFWFFWGLSMLVSLVEAVTYSGFIIKHTGLNPLLTITPAIFLSLTLLVLNFVKKNKKSQKNDKALVFFSVFLLILYIVLKIVDRLTYANFVFSNLHIQPNNLLWPVLISFLSIVFVWFPRINFKKLLTSRSVLFLFVTSIIVFNIYRIYKMEWWAFQFIITHPQASYDDKMRRAVGPVFYNFTQFINTNTPEDSSILIPPQAFPWPQSGNEAFMRYFIHPRKMGNGKEYNPQTKLSDYDFIVLNWGETDSTEPPYTHSWPKFDVPAEGIIFMNADGTFGGEIKGNYYYKDYIDKKVWGLIIIKH
jgi:hypothetical protein